MPGAQWAQEVLSALWCSVLLLLPDQAFPGLQLAAGWPRAGRNLYLHFVLGLRVLDGARAPRGANASFFNSRFPSSLTFVLSIPLRNLFLTVRLVIRLQAAYPEDWLGITFSLLTSGNGIVAVCHIVAVYRCCCTCSVLTKGSTRWLVRLRRV